MIARPDDPESLIDEERFEEDEFLPYWAELWPSGLALAGYVGTLDLAGRRVLEVGCGLALPSFAAALAGADVLATDWAPEALELDEGNAAANGLVSRRRSWTGARRAPRVPAFDLVLAADVLYEERNAVPLLGLLAAATVRGATLSSQIPGAATRRRSSSTRAGGWSIQRVPASELASGGIAIVRRATFPRG